MDIRALKQFVKERLHPYPFTRDLVLSEPDSLSPEELAIKSGIWCSLLAAELRKNASR